MKIVQQGPVIVNDHSWLIVDTEDVKLMEVDLKSKYCVVDVKIGDLGLGLGTNVHSCKLDENYDREGFTEINFKDEYEGYEIFQADISRYTLRITFVNKKKMENV
jgi:hypothetical protein